MSTPLLIYLNEDFSEADATELRRATELLAGTRPWTVQPPYFVDESDDSSCTRPEDEPIRTVGAVLEVTDPGEEPGTPLDEATAFIEGIAMFARKRHLIMAVQIGQTDAGEIIFGILDEAVRVGLLETW